MLAVLRVVNNALTVRCAKPAQLLFISTKANACLLVPLSLTLLLVLATPVLRLATPVPLPPPAQVAYQGILFQLKTLKQSASLIALPVPSRRSFLQVNSTTVTFSSVLLVLLLVGLATKAETVALLVLKVTLCREATAAVSAIVVGTLLLFGVRVFGGGHSRSLFVSDALIDAPPALIPTLAPPAGQATPSMAMATASPIAQTSTSISTQSPDSASTAPPHATPATVP